MPGVSVAVRLSSIRRGPRLVALLTMVREHPLMGLAEPCHGLFELPSRSTCGAFECGNDHVFRLSCGQGLDREKLSVVIELCRPVTDAQLTQSLDDVTDREYGWTVSPEFDQETLA